MEQTRGTVEEALWLVRSRGWASRRTMWLHVLTVTVAALAGGCYTPRPDIPDGYQVYTKGVLPADTTRDYLLFPGDELEVMFLFSSAVEDEYRLGIGDQLRVEFFDYPALDRTVDVRPDGKITLPYKGDVRVVGLTPMEAARRINQLYADFLKHPQATVTLVRYSQQVRELKDALRNGVRGQRLTVPVNPDGNIMLPHLSEPLMVAGLTLEQARRKINQAYRPVISNVEVGVTLLAGRGNIVYVFGQVKNPGFYELKGPTTALQAVAMAGGLTEKGKAETVLWVTRDEARHPVGRVLDLDRIITTGNAGEDVLLRQGDVLYVPFTRLADAALVAENIFKFIPVNLSFFYFLPVSR